MCRPQPEVKLRRYKGTTASGVTPLNERLTAVCGHDASRSSGVSADICCTLCPRGHLGRLCTAGFGHVCTGILGQLCTEIRWLQNKGNADFTSALPTGRDS